MTFPNLFKRLGAIGGAGLLLGFVGLTNAHAAASAPPGPEVCKGCHEAYADTYAASKHGTKTDKRTPANAGECSVCHGDGTAHVNAGGGKGVGGIINPSSKLIAAEDKNKVCLTCHRGDPSRIHWNQSVHATRDVACTSCHRVHTTHDDVRDKLTQPQVCFACHKEQRAQVNKPSRHPILEGKVSCADCHNVHGNNPKQLVKYTVNETCFQCHMEKRGPFLYQHQPVTEDCSICHQPHGTTTPTLLKSRPPFLCQECHSTYAGPGGHAIQPAGVPITRAAGSGSGTAGTIGRGCLNCHTNIHGSNSTENNSTTRHFRR